MSTIQAVPVLAVSVLAAVLLVEVIRRLLTGRLVARWPRVQRTARRCALPGYAVAAAAGARIVLAAHLVDLALIGSVTWLVIRAAFVMTDAALDRLTTIEGERGRIEELALTYVVMCMWDERRISSPPT